jgi:hypothetical protein
MGWMEGIFGTTTGLDASVGGPDQRITKGCVDDVTKRTQIQITFNL